MNIDTIIKKFDVAINDPKTYRDVFKSNSEDVYGQIAKIESIRFKAVAGDRESIDFMIEKLCRFLYMYNDINDFEIIDFKNIKDNPDPIKLILLLEVVELNEIIKMYCDKPVLDHASLEVVFDDNLDVLKQRFSNLKDQMNIVAKVVFSNVYGLGIIDFLRARFINEIGILRKDFIYVITGGRKIRIEAAKIESNEALQNILKKATLTSNSPFDKSNPISVSSRKNTDRIAVAGFDVSPDESELYMNIRIFNLESIRLEELRDKYATLNDEIFRFLEINQRGKGSFFVTGADMNVGKSTMLLAMLQKLPDEFAIGIIDPQNEMRVGTKYPDKNSITLISNEIKNTDECFEYLLKTSRDVIAVSEITNSNEATQLINGALRLNCGICATMHSLNPGEVLTNLRNLMMRTDMYTNENIAAEDIKRGIDLIIHLRRIKERIVIDSIDEITKDGLNRIFEFMDNDWKRINDPTLRYYKKISGYLEKRDLDAYERIFGGCYAAV